LPAASFSILALFPDMKYKRREGKGRIAVALHPKVTATVVAGALTGLIISELNRRAISIAPDEAADITVLLSAVAGWFMPSDDGPAPVADAPVAAPPPPAPAQTIQRPISREDLLAAGQGQAAPLPAPAPVTVPSPAG
jgi:hypothetical protein